MTERERFETWAKSTGLESTRLGRHPLKSDCYRDDYVDDLWEGWKARAQSDSQAPVAPMPDLADFPPQDYYADNRSFWDQVSMRKFAHASVAKYMSAQPTIAPALQVWYGPMPESNGKTNWTAILHRGDVWKGITLDRSEYPDRVRYEADRMRWMIGEIAQEPDILSYDADKHSGYVAPSVAHQGGDADTARLNYLDWRNQKANERHGTTYGWRLTENHNRLALEDHNFPAISVRQAIDNEMARLPIPAAPEST